MSHPSRVRGLKQKKLNLKSLKIRVAPLAGAWIETCKIKGRVEKLESHPSRVRGLKLPGTMLHPSPSVAPLAGAWIETSIPLPMMQRVTRSHPSRVRGLKLHCQDYYQSVQRRTPRGCVD